MKVTRLVPIAAWLVLLTSQGRAEDVDPRSCELSTWDSLGSGPIFRVQGEVKIEKVTPPTTAKEFTDPNHPCAGAMVTGTCVLLEGAREGPCDRIELIARTRDGTVGSGFKTHSDGTFEIGLMKHAQYEMIAENPELQVEKSAYFRGGDRATVRVIRRKVEE